MNLRSILIFAGFLAAVTTVSPVHAEQFPGCKRLFDWALTGWNGDANVVGGAYHEGKHLMTALRDEHFVPLFGMRFSEWSDDDLVAFRHYARNCVAPYMKGGAPRSDPLWQVMNAGAKSFLVSTLGVWVAMDKPYGFLSLLGHQRLVYAEHAKAVALRDQQFAQATAMSATKENIATLQGWVNEKQFEYLVASERREHQTFLHNRAIELADEIVQSAIETMQAQSNNLAGLRGLIEIYTETKRKNGQLQSTRWNSFEQVYRARLNEAALAALSEFEAEVKSVPIATESKQMLQNKLTELFPVTPTPSNYHAYRQIVSAQLNVLSAALEARACDDFLEGHDLNEVRETPLLGHRGETTLGEFLCGLDAQRYSFAAYEEAGWFEDTSRLTLTTNRGISLTVELQAKEAVRGKELLVGVRVYDASNDKTLNLNEWQDLAGAMVGHYR